MKDTKYIICDSEENLNRGLVGIVRMLTYEGKPCCIRVLDHNKDYDIGHKVIVYCQETYRRPDGQWFYNGEYTHGTKVVAAFLKYSRAVEIYEIKNVNEPIIWRTTEL